MTFSTSQIECWFPEGTLSLNYDHNAVTSVILFSDSLDLNMIQNLRKTIDNYKEQAAFREKTLIYISNMLVLL